ncbi:cysteine desulfurase [bacterium]|nr:cysteine desulfurase [bacterium]
MRVYLDHNAGSPIRPSARSAMVRCLEEERGNPASAHRSGQRARRELERARERVAELLGARPETIVFTSGGAESNNLAIFGAARAAGSRRRIVSSAIEHSSVLAPLADLEARGFEVVRLAPDRDGRIDAGKAAAAIDDNVALITLGLVNAEVGAIQQVAPIAEAARRARAVFHLDAAQAVGRMPIDVRSLGCDLLTMSGHKIGGPSGIGALYCAQETQVAPLILGGPQERGMRAGTPNLPGAVGFRAAAEEVASALHAETSRIASLANALLEFLLGAIPGLELNGPRLERVPNTLNLTFPGVLGESLLMALDLEGVEASMGSACAAGAVEPSHVLVAMGRTASAARSSLRISLGWSTTDEEIAFAAATIARVWRRVAAAEPITETRDSGVAETLR